LGPARLQTQLIYSKLKFEIKPFVLKDRKESSKLGTKGNYPKKEQQQSYVKNYFKADLWLNM